MSYYYLIPLEIHEQVKKLYIDGYSAQEIIDLLKIKTTPRSIQRLVKKWGISREVGDAFRNAIARGRVRYVKKDLALLTKRSRLKPGLRYKILERDNFRCRLCGCDASKSLLEVDHIDNDATNNDESNLQTLCYECNIGKPTENRKNYTSVKYVCSNDSNKKITST